MAGTTQKKRSRDDVSRSKAAPPLKKQKKKQQQQQRQQQVESDDAEEFQAVNLLDSDDDDIHNAQVDDGGDSDSGSDAASIGSMSSSGDDERPRATRTKPTRPQPIARDVPANKLARDAPGASPKKSKPSSSGWEAPQSGDEDDDDDDAGVGAGEDNDEFSDLDDEPSSGDEADPARFKQRMAARSKRNDPEAFATSMTKILGTKISGKNRADPVLARSADARERVRLVQDEELDRKARRKLREQKQRAMEKGRVRDVLVATNATFSNVNPVTGQVIADTDGETTGEVLATERRLRKVAQRGVVQLFNAFRTAQVKAAEAERVARKQGVIGMDNKKDKVTEMSKKGFLDLIASGGGGLKKGPIEEA